MSGENVCSDEMMQVRNESVHVLCQIHAACMHCHKLSKKSNSNFHPAVVLYTTSITVL